MWRASPAGPRQGIDSGYGVDMIVDGFAILAKASGKAADEDAGE